MNFSYDTNGNLESDGVRGYEWDSLSRLKKITWAAGKTTVFKYNALGQRCERIDTDGASISNRFYLFDGIRPLDMRVGVSADAAGIVRRYFEQGEQRGGGSTWTSYHYCRDHLGSIREVVGASGSLVARYDYDPYGKRITQYQSSTYGGGGCEFGYTGHVTVPSPVTGQTEIVLTHFRPYDPELGRWLSADPLEKVTGEMAELLPEGSNLYSYIGNSPMNGLDPLGLLNPAKCLSSIGNAANASRLYAAGMTKLAGAAGLTSTGAGAPAGVGAAVWGGWNISAGMSAQKRGMQQWSEAFNEEWSDASWKNLLGVLPFGTEGDDPCEPSLWDVYKSKARNFSEKPLEFLREFGTFGF